METAEFHLDTHSGLVAIKGLIPLPIHRPR